MFAHCRIRWRIFMQFEAEKLRFTEDLRTFKCLANVFASNYV